MHYYTRQSLYIQYFRQLNFNVCEIPEWASDLTKKAKGRHFIGDFLPKEELDKFLGKVKAVKEGGEFVYEDYAEHKLTDENIGYKMLQKAGWEEGKGLGSAGEGITAPINKYEDFYMSIDVVNINTQFPSP